MVSFGLGLATLNRTGDLLDVYYPTPLLDPDPGLVALWRQAYPALETSDWVLIDAKGAEAEPSLTAELSPFHQALDESNPYQGLIVTLLVEDAPILLCRRHIPAWYARIECGPCCFCELFS